MLGNVNCWYTILTNIKMYQCINHQFYTILLTFHSWAKHHQGGGDSICLDESRPLQMEGFSKLSPVVNMGWILKWSSMTWMIWGTSILGSPPQMPMKWDRIVQDSLLYRTVVASGSVALGSDSNSTQQCWEKGKPSGNNPIYFRSVFHGENDLNWKCWVRKRLWRISTPKLPEKKALNGNVSNLFDHQNALLSCLLQRDAMRCNNLYVVTFHLLVDLCHDFESFRLPQKLMWENWKTWRMTNALL